MLRIITSKLYRAFPELDGFDDDQCERLLRHVKSGVSYGPSLVLALLGFGVVSFLLGIVLGRVITGALTVYFLNLAGRYWSDYLVMLVYMILTLSIPAVVGLVTRDVVMRIHIRRAMAARLKRIQCLGCKYLLLGQRVIEGFVTCPECGMRMTLQQLDLRSPMELAPPDADEDELIDSVRQRLPGA